MKNTFVLKHKWFQWGFELGFFNLIGLAVLLPVFWLDYLDHLCWKRHCCHHSREVFYQDNLSRLLIMCVMLGLMTLLEVGVLSQSLDRSESQPSVKKWTQYILWMLLRSLAVLVLLIAVLALPESQFIYWTMGLAGVYVFMGSATFGNLWGPVFALNQTKAQARFRQHLKPLTIYLSALLIGVPALRVVSLPFQFGTGDSACVSSIKANMHTLQTVVETYAVEWNGAFPTTLDVLEADARAKNYWKEINNPYLWSKIRRTALATMPASIDVLEKNVVSEQSTPYRDIWGIRIHHESFLTGEVLRGVVFYDYIGPNSYYLYGSDQNGKLLRDRRGFQTLSNS